MPWRTTFSSAVVGDGGQAGAKALKRAKEQAAREDEIWMRAEDMKAKQVANDGNGDESNDYGLRGSLEGIEKKKAPCLVKCFPLPQNAAKQALLFQKRRLMNPEDDGSA
nr:hypothetical protein Iba_chr07eCG4880 [Ipomoea batatas]